MIVKFIFFVNFVKGFIKSWIFGNIRKFVKKIWFVNDVFILFMRSGKLFFFVGDIKLNRLLYDYVIIKMKDD